MKNLKKILTIFLIALLFAGCSSKTTKPNEDKVIKVGATAVPHAMILKDVVADILAEEGWTLEVVEFTDYVMPNTTLEEGEIDANYFQTLGYMNDQNENRGLHLVAVAGVHYEPMTLFSAPYTSIDQFKEGDVITVPNDYDNELRAYNLLAAAGLIEYDESLNTPDDATKGITANPKGLVFSPNEAASLPLTLEDAKVQGSVINGNYALEGDAKSKGTAVYVEQLSDEAIAKRTNYICVKEGNENSEKTQALTKAITSAAVKEYIAENYGSAVICTFE